jgi:hypothetical protein
MRIAFIAHTNNFLTSPWRERIDNMLLNMRESDRPKVSIRQAESQYVFHDIEKREDPVMNRRWKIEEGFRARQADFSCIVTLDSCGFAGVVLRENVPSSTL